MAMKKVVIFDLDGTLTNSLASMKLSGDMAMAKFGMGPYTEDQYKVFVGDGARVLVERCLIAGGDTELKIWMPLTKSTVRCLKNTVCIKWSLTTASGSCFPP